MVIEKTPTTAMNNAFFYDAINNNVDNERTRGNYKNRLNALIVRLAPDSPAQEHKLVLHVLTHPRFYMPILEKSYNNKVATVKNMLTFILALYKYANLKCSLEATYKKWKQFHERYSAKEQEQYNSNEPTKSQVEKYTSFEEMNKKLREWPSEDPHQDFKSSLHYCLISMYATIKPKRADFGRVRIFERDPRRTDINYLVLNDVPRFVFNKINKTHRAGSDAIIEPINKDLADTFSMSLSRHPRKYLFVGRDRKSFKTSNAFSKFVINTFKKYFGRSTGVSMLRHIYISEKMDMNKLSVQEKDDIAKSMGHSRRQQEQYKFVNIPGESKNA
jgi:hypothetical protein